MKTNKQKAALIIALIEAHDMKHWGTVCTAFNDAGVPFNDNDRMFTEHYLDYINETPSNYEWDKVVR